MAPRVPKGNHRDPFVKTVLPKPQHRTGEQPLLLSDRDYRKALDGHDAPLSTCYLFFISFFFYACGASIILIQGVYVSSDRLLSMSGHANYIPRSGHRRCDPPFHSDHGIFSTVTCCVPFPDCCRRRWQQLPRTSTSTSQQLLGSVPRLRLPPSCFSHLWARSRMLQMGGIEKFGLPLDKSSVLRAASGY